MRTLFFGSNLSNEQLIAQGARERSIVLALCYQLFVGKVGSKEDGSHVFQAGPDRHNPYIVIACNFLNEPFVSSIVPSIVAKEPSSMHVQTPGCSVARNQLTAIVYVTLINPLEVLHQHVVHLVWVLCSIIVSLHDGAGIQHTARVSIVGC